MDSEFNWGMAGMSMIERVKASFEARCLKADMILSEPRNQLEAGAEIIVLRDWMVVDVDRAATEGAGIVHRQVDVWMPLDRPGRWFKNRGEAWHSRSTHIGRYRQFWLWEHADEMARAHASPDRMHLWAGDDGRAIDEAIERFVAMVHEARDEARAEAADWSRRGREGGFAEKLVDAAGSKERLLNIAAALKDTPDAAEAQRIASEYSGDTPIKGRLKRLKAMARKHSVWTEGMGL